jgi:hypothetical protein
MSVAGVEWCRPTPSSAGKEPAQELEQEVMTPARAVIALDSDPNFPRTAASSSR